MTKPELSYDFVNQAANHPDVLKQLQIVADRIKKRAQGYAAEAGLKLNVTTEAGVRPGGRPYVDVVSDNAEQEFGSSMVGRLRILGRAGEQG